MAAPIKAAAFACFFLVGILMIFPAKAQKKLSYEDYRVAVLRVLDKVTAESEILDVPVGEISEHDKIFLRPQACRKTPPVEKPEAAAFIQVWEVAADDSPQWIYSGWMFASSPSLSAMEHSIYDVWVIDCKKEVTSSSSEGSGAE